MHKEDSWHFEEIGRDAKKFFRVPSCIYFHHFYTYFFIFMNFL